MVTKKAEMDSNHISSGQSNNFCPEMRSRRHSMGAAAFRRKPREAGIEIPSNMLRQKVTNGMALLPDRPSNHGLPKTVSPCGSLTASPVLQRRRGSLQINTSHPLVMPRRSSISTSESMYMTESSSSTAHCQRCANKHERVRDQKLCQNCEGELIFDYKKLEIRRRTVPKVAFGKSMKDPEDVSSSYERLPEILTPENSDKSPEVTDRPEPLSTDDYITSCMLAASTSAVFRQPVPDGSSLFDSLRSELLPEKRENLEIPDSTRNRSNSMPYGFRWKGFQIIQSEEDNTV